MRNLIEKAFRGIEKVSEMFGMLAAYGIFFLIAFLTFNVIMRYFLKSPLAFTEEVTGYTLVFIVFMGLAYTMKVGAHVVTNVLTRHFSRSLQEKLDIPRNLIGVLFGFFVAAAAWKFMIKNYVRNVIDYGSLGTPVWIPNSIFVVGATLFLAEAIVLLIRITKRGDR